LENFARKILIALVLIGITSVLLTLSLPVLSLGNDVILNITNGVAYSLWAFYLIFLFLAPFLDVFSEEGSAVLSLREFCDESTKGFENTDFSLLSYASKNISYLLESYNITIPSHQLAFASSCQNLKNKDKNLLIELANNIENFPKNISAVVTKLENTLSFGNYSEWRGLKAKIPSAKMEQVLKFLATIVPIVTAIIALIRGL